jgi:competence protein ComEC
LFQGILQTSPKNSPEKFQGKLKLIWIQEDSLKTLVNQTILIKIKPGLRLIHVHDTIIGSGILRLIDPAKNPHSFCLKSFYAKENIHYSITSKENQIQLRTFSGKSLKNISHRLSKHLQDRISLIFDDDGTAAFVKAIFLGYKNDLSNEVKEIFSMTGAAHILAVSGLHVAIIFSIILFITGPPEKGKFIIRLFKCTLILCIIWLYACVTGLSPSVIRASVMLSIYSIGRSIDRKGSAWNVIGIAIFVMVISNPLMVLQIGFQFSFAAVAGILLLYQPIQACLQTQIKPIRKIWQMTSVTISAQLFILPLSIYYFHQFPLTFIASSLIAIPLGIFILTSSMASLTISFVSITLSQFITEGIDCIYHILIDILSLLKCIQPVSWSSLMINELQLIGIIAGTIAMLLHFAKKRYQYILIAACIFSGVCLNGQINKANRNSARTITIFHRYAGTSISFQHDSQMLILEDVADEFLHRFVYQPHSIAQQTKQLEIKSLTDQKIEQTGLTKFDGHFLFDDRHLIIVDGLMHISQSAIDSNPVDYILVNTPDIEALNALSIENCPIVIINTSVPPWKKSAIIDYCIEHHLTFHDISEKGAFISTQKIN